MKLTYLERFDIEKLEIVAELRKLGLEVVATPDATTDFIWNANTDFIRAQDIAEHFPKMKMINYVWDFYDWAFNKPREKEIWDWQGYAAFLKQHSHEIWTPNEGTKLRINERLGLAAHIIHSAIPVYEEPGFDGGYVLNHMRAYPEVNFGITKHACAELGIPYIESKHLYSTEEWRKVVSGCRFMVCEYMEASTGGLTLLEGLWNGKPSLVSNSVYQGGIEYLGQFANTFQWDNYEDFKSKLKEMWEKPPIIDIPKARAYITTGFSNASMAKAIFERLTFLHENSPGHK